VLRRVKGGVVKVHLGVMKPTIALVPKVELVPIDPNWMVLMVVGRKRSR